MCQFALAQMNAACERAADNAAYRIALSVAQYRLGKFEKERYPEALTTRTKCDQSQPATLAFLAMTQHQLAKKDEAKTTLGRLRDVMKQERWAKDQQARAFVTEAEALLQTTASHPKT